MMIGDERFVKFSISPPQAKVEYEELARLQQQQQQQQQGKCV